MEIKKIWSMTNRFQRILKDLEFDWKYSINSFVIDVIEFLKNEDNIRYRKHWIVVKWWKV